MKLIILIFFLLACSGTRNYQKSDHYKHKQDRFYNPTAPDSEKTFTSFLKWKLGETAADWPDAIKLEHTPKVGEVLKKQQANITFVNHSTLLIEMQGINILTDPIWSERTSPVSWAGPKRVHPPGIPFKQLPKIDLVLISHNHYDHLDKDTLIKLEKKFSPLFLCALGDKNLLSSLGLKNVKELDWWHKVNLKEMVITFTPTQHWSGRGLFDRYKSLWGSYILEYQDKTIYFGGDAAYSPHFKDIAKRFPQIDLAFLPIGAYAPRWFMQLSHMDPEEAIWAHKDLKALRSIGIHFGSFQLTDESINEPLEKLNTYRLSEGLRPQDFFTLKPGQSNLIDL